MAVTEAPAEETGVGGIRGLEPLLYIPFMLHVLLVLVIVWISSSLHFNNFIFLCLCFAYLFQIEKRGREKEQHRIAHEERKKMNTEKGNMDSASGSRKVTGSQLVTLHALTEGETLRWLNEALTTIWPVCMQNFVSKHFFSPMAPWFLNLYKPWSVKGITLQSLNLGKIPPTFSLIRVLDLPMEEDHVVFEAAMEFVTGDDMSAVMTVHMIRRLGGFSTSFYISNLRIEGTVKVSVRFEEGWPVIGRVRFCFANAPSVTMTARPRKTGPDLNLIPGVANWLERTIAFALEQSVVEPNLLVVDMKMLVSNMMFPDLRPQPPRANGNDFFYVETKWASPVVRVDILEATDLKAADSNGLSDPFVEIKLGQTNKKTATKKKTLNPKWNETHRLPIVNWDLPNQLILRVRDKDLFGPDELGICTVAIKEFRDGLRHEMTLPLQSVASGHLKVAITLEYNNQGNQTFEEPRSSGASSQPVTQEIQTNGTAANHFSPGGTSSTVMKRSNSETQLTKHPLKQKGRKQHNRNSPAGTIPSPRPPQEQIFNGETSEFIAMPYGPDGTFAIRHPGKIVPKLFPTRPMQGNMRKQKASTIGKVDVDPQAEQVVRNSWKSMLNIFGRKDRRNDISPERLPAERETNPSETGHTSSFDRSMELRVIGAEMYSGNVKMNLVPPDSKSLAPEEPPDIFVGPSPPLAPILSGHDSTIVSGSFSWRRSEVGVISEQSNEKQDSKNRTIFGKMKNKLTKRLAKKKKRSNGIEHSAELILTEGCYASLSQTLLYESEQSGASASHSFRRESCDLKKIMNSSHSGDGSTPEKTLIKLGLSDKP